MSLRTGAARLITIAACGGAAVLSSTANCAAAPSGKLMDMLPQGFSATNCQEKAPVEGALERVMCGQSSDPGGPSYAVFLLYGSGSDLATEFRQGPGRSGYTVASSCPGGGASPGTWSYRTPARPPVRSSAALPSKATMRSSGRTMPNSDSPLLRAKTVPACISGGATRVDDRHHSGTDSGIGYVTRHGTVLRDCGTNGGWLSRPSCCCRRPTPI